MPARRARPDSQDGQNSSADSDPEAAAALGNFDSGTPKELSLEEEFLQLQRRFDEEKQLSMKRGELENLFEGDGEKSVSLAEDSQYWAKPDPEAFDAQGLPRPGTVLLANPDNWLTQSFPAAMLSTGVLPMPPDPEVPRKLKANLPVVLVTKREASGRLEGLLLGRWSGELLGDKGWVCFKTRPLYIGRGPYFFPGRHREEPSQVWRVLHKYNEIPEAIELTDDGLCVSDDVDQTLDYILGDSNATISTIPFKFFQMALTWTPKAAESEFDPGAQVWMPARCSREILLREPDSPFEEPLWVQIAERCGGEFEALALKYGLFPDDKDSN